jgi:nucleotide-binding universal stress UspA family protein
VTEICDAGLLREFPRRTEADLYLWVVEHQSALAEELGWQVGTDEVARDLVERFSPGVEHHATGLGERVLEAVFPEQMGSGPPPGRWREEKMTARNVNCLFTDILVPVNGTQAGWNALEQAIGVAQRECGRLRGLYVVRTPDREKSARARRVQERFEQRCTEAGITGKLVVTSGEVTRQILERSRWNDLVIFNLSYPPAPGLRGRLASGVHKIVQSSPVPVLVTPGMVSPLSRALLVYDGSPKAREALFVATYLGGRWGIPLAVVTILREGQDAQLKAFDYLEAHSVQAVYVEDWGEISPVIMRVAKEQNSDLIVMGGYSRGPLLNVFIDDVVDQVLRKSRKPVLLCR